MLAVQAGFNCPSADITAQIDKALLDQFSLVLLHTCCGHASRFELMIKPCQLTLSTLHINVIPSRGLTLYF
jgi:hypothetical protein